MLLDGKEIKIGDQLYHLTLGDCVVETIEKKTARLRITKGGGIKDMAEGGLIHGERLIFWGKPLIIAPVKGEEALFSASVDLFYSIKAMLKAE